MNFDPHDRKVLVRLKNITKDYGKFRALEDISLEMKSGVTGLLGPNGAGKSTMIKVVLGLVKLTAGEGDVQGLDIRTQTKLIRDKVGYMPEDDCYIPGLSGIQMMQFSARLSGLPSLEAMRRGHEILDFAGAGQERYRPVETYSTGMRQKLKFAQAIVHDPDLLILDEPTSGLDPEERVAMLSRIKTLNKKHNKTVILCTHILPDVQETCHDVIIIAKGKVRVTDNLENLNRPVLPSYHIRPFGDGDKLASHLQELEDVEVKVKRQENGDLTVIGDMKMLAKNIWKWSDEAGVPIRSLTPARNSIEQIFLDAVKEKSDAYP